VRLVLERRSEHSRLMAVMSPVIAIGLTVLVGAAIFALRGVDPLYGLYIYFIDPLTTLWSLEQLVVKATPLILIGVGLAICFSANVWNIGAEGQLTMGAIFGSMVPVLFTGWQSPLAIATMMVLGCLGGMAWAAIPAILKNRFGASEILTSLMLVYVAQLFLDWLVRGPWRDPMGFNFPKSVTFQGWHLMPTFGGTVHLGSLFAVVVVIILAVVVGRTMTGFEVKVLGNAPRAGRFAGFSRRRMVIFCFLLSGGLAGFAGLAEVASTVGQLQPTISPGYGFTAIIVAFLGRLNPVGVLLAGFLLAISYLGGEAAQITLGISDKIARVFQGILLFFVLACDTLILYRIRLEVATRAPHLAPHLAPREQRP
jgi:general nucleoside transport system permease protein